MKNLDEHFMGEALFEARKASPEDTAPNPRVGCVITHEDKIIARGYHHRDGEAHAEREALSNLQHPMPKNAKLYVTLEPCSTIGRTGACCEAIIQSGVKEVIIGAIDPNPKHRGRSIKILQEAKIEVRCGVLEKECEALNPEFNRRMSELS
jgi:diaminohydroxyphosphoribosylaminopyrimidine deaminase/5-amino-6-(5-phosphoribosylamino)uracil reductase